MLFGEGSMAITKETVEYVAHLARIELQSKELEKLSRQLQDILDFIDKLNKINTDNIAPTSHILPVSNVLREDTPGGSLPVDKALQNAPCRERNFFVVPKVIE
jgi:aspartyl-tRNA(Asn)/glutamyl-tRNA(Gln) amidotransferase subunit C